MNETALEKFKNKIQHALGCDLEHFYLDTEVAVEILRMIEKESLLSI
jgi:hypothetical protein